MKVIINAQGVRELIKDNPEIEVELGKNAADQVAQAIRRREANIENAVGNAISAACGRVGWGATTINKDIQSAISVLARQAVEKAIPATVHETMSAAFRKEIQDASQKIVDRVVAAVQDRVMRDLDERLDELITARLSKLSLTVAS